MKRLREEAGMTIMELLVAMTVGMVVITGVFTMLDSTVRLNTGVMAKTDAMQRGRLAMDVITQELRSQVCLNNLSNPAIVGDKTTKDSVTFYSDFSDAEGDRPVEKRKLSYDRATRNITTSIYRTAKLKPLPTDFPLAPATVQMRLENVNLQRDANNNEIPFLRYYAYQWIGGRPTATEELVPNATTGLTPAQAARVARVDITFIARPTGATDDKKGVRLTDQIMVRHADPNLSVPDPKCI
jgi:hypothetical protein